MSTLAEYVRVPTDRLHEKPTHCSDEEAAAIPLAGLTAYRAVFRKGEVKKGQRVLITGIGGGVAQFAMQFALAAGAEVEITSGQKGKIKKAIEYGVQRGFHYRDKHWMGDAILHGPYDVIIDGAGGNNLNTYLKLIKPAGKIILYGSTTGHPEKLDVFRLFWSQCRIEGTTMGNDTEFSDMLNWINTHGIKPIIDQVFDFSDYTEAFNRFLHPDHFGKIVLRL
jgi:NADPH:quinone reductase-like Zn-dependent oxidoreductase